MSKWIGQQVKVTNSQLKSYGLSGIVVEEYNYSVDVYFKNWHCDKDRTLNIAKNNLSRLDKSRTLTIDQNNLPVTYMSKKDEIKMEESNMKIKNNLFNVLKVQDIVNNHEVYVATLEQNIPTGMYVLYSTEKLTKEQLESIKLRANENYNVSKYYNLHEDMNLQPTKIHIGLVLQYYSVAEYIEERQVITGMFISCINMQAFCTATEKQLEYLKVVQQLEQKKQMMQERQVYAMLAAHDPEAQQLLQQLDALTGYVETTNQEVETTNSEIKL